MWYKASLWHSLKGWPLQYDGADWTDTVCRLYLQFFSVPTPIWFCWKCMNKMSTTLRDGNIAVISPYAFWGRSPTLPAGRRRYSEKWKGFTWNIASSLKKEKVTGKKVELGHCVYWYVHKKQWKIKSSQWPGEKLNRRWWEAAKQCDLLFTLQVLK